jgi:hypothetical protein
VFGAGVRARPLTAFEDTVAAAIWSADPNGVTNFGYLDRWASLAAVAVDSELLNRG